MCHIKDPKISDALELTKLVTNITILNHVSKLWKRPHTLLISYERHLEGMFNANVRVGD